jgi:hypothetical protein
MPPPAGVSFPTRRFVVTRVDEATGVETIVIQSTPLPTNYTTDADVRPGLMDNARAYLAANPGIYRIYSPCNPPAAYYTDGDCVWDSRVSDPL